MIDPELLKLIEEEADQPCPMLVPATLRWLLKERRELVTIAEAAQKHRDLCTTAPDWLLINALNAYFGGSE